MKLLAVRLLEGLGVLSSSTVCRRVFLLIVFCRCLQRLRLIAMLGR